MLDINKIIVEGGQKKKLQKTCKNIFLDNRYKTNTIYK